MSGAFRDGQVHVSAERCPSCVFRPGNLMHLGPGRLASLIADNVRADSALTCHETLDDWPGERAPAVCRGFWDHPRALDSLPVRLCHTSSPLAPPVVYDA